MTFRSNSEREREAGGASRDDGASHDRGSRGGSHGHFTYGGDSQSGASPFGTSWSGSPMGDASLGLPMGGTLGGGYRGSFGDSPHFRGHSLSHDHQEHRGKGPKGYKRSDDRIKDDVCEEISNHGGVDGTDIEVEVQDGEVTLTGQVRTRQQKRLAEDCIEDVRGVVDVHNRLRVGSSTERDSENDSRQTIQPTGASRSAPTGSSQQKRTSSSPTSSSSRSIP